MKPTSGSRTRRTEAGFISVEFMAAVLMSFSMLMFAMNFIAIQYGKGVVRAAVDEGARAGARVVNDPEARCLQRANNMLDSLGSMARNVTVTCNATPTQMVVRAEADFPPWVPIVDNFHEEAVATSIREGQF